MRNRSSGASSTPYNTEAVATSLKPLFTRWADLLEALIALREHGLDASESDSEPVDAAISAVLDLRQLKQLSTSWRLWELLVISDGGDPDSLLGEFIDPAVVAAARLALWGEVTDPLARRRLARSLAPG